MYLPFYIAVSICLIYLLYLYQSNSIALIIISVFFAGLAAYLGKVIENPYKIYLLGLTIYVAIKFHPFSIYDKKDKFVLMSFAFFSLIFFMSAYLNHTNFILALSQYGKFLVPFTCFFILKFVQKKNLASFIKIGVLLLFLLKIQIILSFVKLLTIGITETTVGSIAYTGGGIATLVPLLGFMLIWIMKDGHLVKKDWRFIILLIFISFMSYKRAIWFMMPTLIFLFLFYVPRRKIPKSLAWIIPCIPLIFFLGVKLNPTLNKEGKIWGSFDLEYVVNYVERYNFGNANKTGREQRLGDGRGGATLLFFKHLSSPDTWTQEDIFGYGLEELATKDYEEFDEAKFGLNSKGAVTGVFNTYISFGFLGVFFLVLYAIILISYVKVARIRFVLIGIFIWEYFFYIGTIIMTQAMALLFMYIILYLNDINGIRAFLKNTDKLIVTK